MSSTKGNLLCVTVQFLTKWFMLALEEEQQKNRLQHKSVTLFVH
jgi:hypothetical protein